MTSRAILTGYALSLVLIAVSTVQVGHGLAGI